MNGYVNIPSILTNRPNWVVWGVVGEPVKAPFQPAALLRFSTIPAKSGAPDTWGSFEDAAACVSKGLALGIGYEFDGNGVYGVDLDNVIENGVMRHVRSVPAWFNMMINSELLSMVRATWLCSMLEVKLPEWLSSADAKTYDDIEEMINALPNIVSEWYNRVNVWIRIMVSDAYLSRVSRDVLERRRIDFPYESGLIQIRSEGKTALDAGLSRALILCP